MQALHQTQIQNAERRRLPCVNNACLETHGKCKQWNGSVLHVEDRELVLNGNRVCNNCVVTASANEAFEKFTHSAPWYHSAKAEKGYCIRTKRLDHPPSRRCLKKSARHSHEQQQFAQYTELQNQKTSFAQLFYHSEKHIAHA